MAAGSRDDGSWSRAFMAGSGLGSASPRARVESPEQHEASGAELPTSRFAQLARHRDPEVREAIARRTDCPMAVLASLAHDSRASVRVAAASNRAANPAILEHLARDRDRAVVKAVARNLSAPSHLRESLALHRWSDVRRVAERTAVEAATLAAQAAGAGEADGQGLPVELRERAVRHQVGDPASAAASSGAERVQRTLAPRPDVGRRSRPIAGAAGTSTGGTGLFLPPGLPPQTG